MTYLLTLGWPWFAGAFMLGALVGFLTFSRAAATMSGGWVALLGAIALATGYGASFADVLSGREATTLDIAVLASLAYAIGLPLGGWIKAQSPEGEKQRPAPAPIIVAPAPAPAAASSAPTGPDALELAAASLAAQATAPILLDAAPLGAGVPGNGHAIRAEAPAIPFESAVASVPAAEPRQVRAKKATPGLKPETLPAPRNGAPDDLARIKGVGPKSLEKLNALGVFHYDQIAAWTLDNAKWIGAAIGAPGRVERDKWIQQARALAGAGTGEQ